MRRTDGDISDVFGLQLQSSEEPTIHKALADLLVANPSTAPQTTSLEQFEAIGSQLESELSEDELGSIPASVPDTTDALFGTLTSNEPMALKPGENFFFDTSGKPSHANPYLHCAEEPQESCQRETIRRPARQKDETSTSTSIIEPLLTRACLFNRNLKHAVVILDHNRPNILGRDPQAHIRLAKPDISRQHCEFQFCGPMWQIRDLESTNGVRVNGQMLNCFAFLRSGTTIQVGDTAFTFFSGQDAEHCLEKKCAPPIVWRDAPYPIATIRMNVERFSTTDDSRRLECIRSLFEMTLRYLCAVMFGALRQNDPPGNEPLRDLLRQIDTRRPFTMGTWVEMCIALDKLADRHIGLSGWSHPLCTPDIQQKLRNLVQHRNDRAHGGWIPNETLECQTIDTINFWDELIEVFQPVLNHMLFSVNDHPQLTDDHRFRHSIRTHMGASSLFSAAKLIHSEALSPDGCYINADERMISLWPVFCAPPRQEDQMDLFYHDALLPMKDKQRITVRAIRRNKVREKMTVKDDHLLRVLQWIKSG